MTSSNPFLAGLEALGGNLLGAGDMAWEKAKAELAQLGQEALADVGAAITVASTDLEGGASIKEIETKVLNMLQSEVQTLLAGFTSGALQALIAFAVAAI